MVDDEPLPRTRDEAAALDATDPLAWARELFLLPEGVVYLDGNSLGALPRATPGRLERVVREEWGSDLIASWNRHGWVDLATRVGDAIAPLIGAGPGEVMVADSTSVDLFKLLAAALRLRPGRPVILSERGNFPTDLYVAQGLADLLGGGVELRLVGRSELEAALDGRTAVLVLTHVDFRTGEVHDLTRLSALAHDAGALALWDLAHSAGALPVDLAGAGADLAVGCGYKYLNGGPGAPAFAFVAGRHHEALRPPLWGWMGHAEPFRFELDYRPAPGVARLACGTPPILSLAALEEGVRAITACGVERLRAKSVKLTELFRGLVERDCAGHLLRLASPRDPERRGSQLSLTHPEGYAIVQALIAEGVVGDFRDPDVLRFGFAPAYLRFVDAFDAARALCRVLEERRWDRPEHRLRAKVT
jgi:kynureninase